MTEKHLAQLKAIATIVGLIVLIAGMAGTWATMGAEVRAGRAERQELREDLDAWQPVLLEVRERLAGIEARLEILIQDRQRPAWVAP